MDGYNKEKVNTRHDKIQVILPHTDPQMKIKNTLSKHIFMR